MKCRRCGQNIEITGGTVSSIDFKCELCDLKTEFISYGDKRHPEYKKRN